MRAIGIAIVATAVALVAVACSKNDKSTSKDPVTKPDPTPPDTPDPEPKQPDPVATAAVDGGARVSTDTPKIDSDADFYVRISHTRGERSKDTHSTHTTVELAGDVVHVVETPKGAHSHRRKTFDFTIKLEADDIDSIKKAMTDRSMMSLPDAVDNSDHRSPYSYQSASVTMRVDGKEHVFKYKGSYSGADERAKMFESPSVDAGNALFTTIRSLAKKRAKDAGEGGK
jgi:hypothetical protein